MQKIANVFGGNSNQSASNSNYSNTAQSSSSSDNSICSRCSGSGMCFNCNRKQRITYQDNRGSTQVREEIRLGSVVCGDCYGDGISKSYTSGGYGPCYVSTCNSGWLDCRRCNGSGKCSSCNGKGTRD